MFIAPKIIFLKNVVYLFAVIMVNDNYFLTTYFFSFKQKVGLFVTIVSVSWTTSESFLVVCTEKEKRTPLM